MYIILEKGWEDKDFIAERTEGFDEFKANGQCNIRLRTSRRSPAFQWNSFTRLLKFMGTTKPMAVFWAMGITQHIVGVRNVMDLANLQMLLGNMGIPGGGVNPLRGQNNVQGACDMGGLPNVYPAYQPVTNEEVRQKFETAWGAPLSAKVGMTVTEMMPGMLVKARSKRSTSWVKIRS